MLDIEHEQVWTALQMIHRETLEAYENTGSAGSLACHEKQSGEAANIEEADKTVRAPSGASFLMAGDEESALVYVPRLTKALVPALREAVKDRAAVVIYFWQPETLRQHIRALNVQHEVIPESLERRFGMKG